MKELVSRKLSNRSDRVLIATNWANTEMIEPQSRQGNELLGGMGLTDKFIVQFWGNMGRPHGIEDLLDAAEMLIADTDIHFLFIGWGTRKAWAVAEQKARGLQNVTILDPLPREESCNVQNACDIAINTLAVGMSGVSVPSRSYNAMAAGKPILAVCESDSELAAMIYEEEIGWVVSPDHPELIASCLREAATNPGLVRAMGERARGAVDARYTLEHVLQVYRDVIEDVRAQ